MGFFDEFTEFAKEVKSLGNELSTVSKDVVKELKSEGKEIKQTLQKTGTDISQTVTDVNGEWKSALDAPSPLHDKKPE